MEKSIPHPQKAVEYLHRGFAIECGNLPIFVESLRWGTTILIMPLERTMSSGSGTWQTQFALHLTARKVERDSPVYYCTFLAARILGTGGTGRLVFPIKEQQAHSQALHHGKQHTADLQACLIEELQRHYHINQILTPARYRLPDAWVWGVNSTLAGTAIRFHEGIWTRLSDEVS